MAHHLKNWEYLIDLMNEDSDYTRDIIKDVIKELGENTEDPTITKVIHKCKVVKARHGLEHCLLFSREDLLKTTKDKHGESPIFETFLEKLDDYLEENKQRHAIDHYL